MLKNLLQNKQKTVFALVLIFLFAAIREFEADLFYDPFLDFFKSDYKNLPLPELKMLPLFWGLLFRYGLNSLISLALLYLLFEDKIMLQFSGLLFAFFFVVLVLIFFSLLYFCQNQNYLILFYVRRFLIQPVFILLFIPAFYYQKISK